MEPNIQKSKMLGWKIGAFLGCLIFLVVTTGYLFQASAEVHLLIILLVLNSGFVGICLGGLIGMMCSSVRPPRWFIFGSKAVIFPVLIFLVCIITFSFLSAHNWNGWDSLFLGLIFVIFPIPLFISGLLASRIHKIHYTVIGYAIALLILFLVYVFGGIGWEIPLIASIFLGPILGSFLTKIFNKNNVGPYTGSIIQETPMSRKGVVGRFFDYFLKP